MKLWHHVLPIIYPRKYKAHLLPDLGLNDQNDPQLYQTAKELVQHLETSISPQFECEVKRKLRAKLGLNKGEMENRWFEWKRFLVLATLIPAIQMYSHDIDEVWHQKLLFTREYEKFCRKYFGVMFHHIPHTTSKKSKTHPSTTLFPHRQWFELLYTILFKNTPYSTIAWQPFYQHPLPKAFLDDFHQLSENRLTRKYFNPLFRSHLPMLTALTSSIIRYIKQELDIYHRNQSNQRSNILLRWSYDRGLSPASSCCGECGGTARKRCGGSGISCSSCDGGGGCGGCGGGS